MISTEERKGKVVELVDAAITKLRLIRKRAVAGDQVPEYHFEGLREIVESLRHNTEMLNSGK